MSLRPPKGYNSWLDYAVANMPTRELFNRSIAQGEVIQREKMRDEAQAELVELRKDPKRLDTMAETRLEMLIRLYCESTGNPPPTPWNAVMTDEEKATLELWQEWLKLWMDDGMDFRAAIDKAMEDE